MQPPVPILRAFDEAKTREFYVDFLGFEILFEHRFDHVAPLYLGVRRGDCVLHLSEHHGDACPGSAIRIAVPDVAALCEELNARAYPYARPGYADQPWGFRELVVVDGAGNRLVFCEPLEGSDGA